MNEIFLIKKAKKGDKDALLKLIMKEKDDFYRLSYSYMKNEVDAMNSLQDMIVKVYENIDKLKDNSKFYSWSKTILVNVCKDSLVKNKKIISIDNYIETGFDEDKDSKLLVEELLNKIEDIYSEVIRLRYLLDYDYEKISEILNIPLGTVKSRLHNGMSKLENIVKEEEYYVR